MIGEGSLDPFLAARTCPQAGPAIVHRAEVRRLGKYAQVTFDAVSEPYVTAWRKSYSIKRYVDDAMAYLNVTSAWDMSYGWQR